MSKIVHNIMLRYASQMVIMDKGNRLEFKFPFNQAIMKRLKGYGARWNGVDKVWYMQKDNEKLPRAIKYFESMKDQVMKEVEEKQERAKEFREELNQGFPLLGFPFIHKDEAKRRGGKWDNVRKVWVMPTLESKMEIEAWSRSLRIELPSNYSFLAKRQGGDWDKDSKMWVLPNKDSYDKVVEEYKEIESKPQKQDAPAQPKRTSSKEEAERIAKDLGLVHTELRSYRDGAEVFRKPDLRRGLHGKLRVGRQFDDKGTLMQVVLLSDLWKVEDGLSVGLTFEYGWAWTIWAAPVPESNTDAHRVHQEVISKGKAEKILENLKNVVRKTGRNVKKETRIRGDIYCYQHDHHKTSLFVVDGNDIWLLERRPFMDSDMFYDRPISVDRIPGEFDGIVARNNPKFVELLQQVEAVLNLKYR